MSVSSDLSIRISPNQSRLYLRFLSVAHLLALLGGLANGLSLPARLVLVLAVILSWVFYLHGVQVEGAKNRPFIVYGEQEGWAIQIGRHPPLKAELLGSSVSTRWMIILHFKRVGRVFRSFIILPDSVDAEDFRKIRMLLTLVEKER